MSFEKFKKGSNFTPPANLVNPSTSTGDVSEQDFDDKIDQIFADVSASYKLILSFAELTLIDLTKNKTSSIWEVISGGLKFGGAALALISTSNPLIKALGVFVSFAAGELDGYLSKKELNSSRISQNQLHEGVEHFLKQAEITTNGIKTELKKDYRTKFKQKELNRNDEYVKIEKMFYSKKSDQYWWDPISEMALMLILLWCDKIGSATHRPFIVLQQNFLTSDAPQIGKQKHNIAFIDFYNFPLSIILFFQNELRNLPLVVLSSLDKFSRYFKWPNITGNPIPLYYLVGDKQNEIYIKLPKEFFWKGSDYWLFCSNTMDELVFRNFMYRLDTDYGVHQKWGNTSVSDKMKDDSTSKYPRKFHTNLEFVSEQSYLSFGHLKFRRNERKDLSRIDSNYKFQGLM